MATLVGVLMVVGGMVVLAVVRPWRSDEPVETPVEARAKPKPRAAKRPRPRPAPGSGPPTGPPKRHRVESISRGRRVPSEPGREEILLPEWLGPVSGPR